MARGKLDKKTVRWMSVVVVFFLIVTLVVTITVWLTNRGKAAESAGLRVTLTQDGAASDTLHVEELNVKPGGKVTAKAEVSCEASGNYTFTLTFTETADSPLKEFLDVTLKKGEEILAEKPLAELLAGETVSFEKQVESGESFTLVIVYSMDVNVEDEAQGAEASFDVVLSVE